MRDYRFIGALKSGQGKLNAKTVKWGSFPCTFMPSSMIKVSHFRTIHLHCLCWKEFSIFSSHSIAKEPPQLYLVYFSKIPQKWHTLPTHSWMWILVSYLVGGFLGPNIIKVCYNRCPICHIQGWVCLVGLYYGIVGWDAS